MSTSTSSRRALFAAATAGMVAMAGQAALADTLVWANTSTSTSAPPIWDNVNPNFNNATTAATGVPFTDGSAVQFNDLLRNGSQVTVQVGNAGSGGVAPSSVNFTHSEGGTTSYNLVSNAAGSSGITGSTGLTLDSGFGGTVFLNNGNTFTGGITINGGTLRAGSGALPATTNVTLNGGTFQTPTGSTGPVYTASQTFAVKSGSSSTISFSAGGSFAAPITSTAGATPANTTLFLGIGGTNTVLNIAFSDASSATPASSFAGTVNFGASTGFARVLNGSPNAVFDLGTSTATFAANTTTVPVIYLGGLAGGSGTILTGAANGTSGTNTTYVIGNAGQNTTFAGLLTAGTRGRPLLNIVGGSLSLTNPNQTFSTNSNNTGAATTVSGGTLYVNNATGSGTGPSGIYVNGGTLGGTGLTNGAVTGTGNSIVTVNQLAATGYATGGRVAPGSIASPVGTLTITSGLTLNDFSNLDFNLNSASATTGNDLIATGNLIAPASGLVQVNFAFSGAAPLTGVAYDLITYTSLTGDPTLWAAAGLPAGYTAAFASDNGRVAVTFAAAAVPEPTTLAALGLAGLAFKRRRRAI